jgi:hypothetical protein
VGRNSFFKHSFSERDFMKIFPTLTRAAALVALAGLFLSSSSLQAGIVLTSNVTGLSGSSFPGVDPITDPQSLGIHEITLSTTAGMYLVGGNSLSLQPISMTQSYSPLLAPGGAVSSALADTTTVSMTNLSSSTETVVLTVTFDAYHFPTTNPMLWTSTIAATRLDNNATFTSTEQVITGEDVNGTITHSTLTRPGSETLDAVVSAGRPFEIVQTLTIVLPAGASASIEKSDTLSAPEPASMIVWSLGACGFGFVAMRRRKAARKSAQ